MAGGSGCTTSRRSTARRSSTSSRSSTRASASRLLSRLLAGSDRLVARGSCGDGPLRDLHAHVRGRLARGLDVAAGCLGAHLLELGFVARRELRRAVDARLARRNGLLPANRAAWRRRGGARGAGGGGRGARGGGTRTARAARLLAAASAAGDHEKGREEYGELQIGTSPQVAVLPGF